MSGGGSKPKFYITTPIYYPNARPHVGSAYTTIACDAIARYKRMCGYDVAFLTGTDEHGEKLQRAADAAGVPVEKFVAEKRELFKDLWRTLGISDYRFVHTSQNPDHVKAVHWMIRQADKAGCIEKKRYEGRYCIFDERYVSDNAEPVNCDICGRPAELIREDNYFFELSAFQERLLNLYNERPEFVQPSYRMNEVKSFVASGLRDISISRRRLKWGIPWPDDPEQVVYVWYDALTSYLTGIGFRGSDKPEPDFEKYWMDPDAERVHMIGKDIIRFHAVYWPAFLMAAGLPLPKTIFAHGWIYYQQDKMSKSKGNVVYPEPIVQAFDEMGAPGNDALRYYLLRDTPFGEDGSFSYGGLIDRYNYELANHVGNLANRTVHLLQQYCDSVIPTPIVDWSIIKEWYQATGASKTGQANARIEALPPDDWKFFVQSGTADLFQWADISRGSFVARFENYELNYALANILGNPDEEFQKKIAGRPGDLQNQNGGDAVSFIAKANRYLSDNAPWKLAKESLHPNQPKVDTIICAAAEAVRFVAALLPPVVPQGSRSIWEQLDCENNLGKIEDQRIDQLEWGQLQPGTKVGKPEPIFPRLKKDEILIRLQELAAVDRLTEKNPKEAPIKVESQPEQKAVAPVSPPATTGAEDSAVTNPKITIDDFAKVDLRAGTIISAEPIPGAKKLLKLMVDIGSEVRQVCAGIAEYYEPAKLVGMKIVLVANLAPRKLRGVESNGMVVAASVGENGKPVLATFAEDVPNGAKLR